MTTKGVANSALLLGKAIKLSRIDVKRIPCVQIRCPENEFNEYVKMYFAKPANFWVLDSRSEVSLGDTVLIRPIKSSDRISATITHEVDRVIRHYGTQIDPITKKRLFSGNFMDRQELRARMVNEIKESAERR